MIFEDESRVNTVLTFFDELLVKSKYDHLVAARFVRFLLVFSRYTERDFHDYARVIIFKFLTFRGHMKETTKAAFAVSLFSRTMSAASDDFAVRYLAYSNLMIEGGMGQEERIPGYPINSWKALKAKTMVDFYDFVRNISKREGGDFILKRLRLRAHPAM